jgi:WD40 repeat protein
MEMEEAALLDKLALNRKDYMSSLNAKQNKLKDMVHHLRDENNKLRAQNERLKAENAQLEGTTYKPAPAPTYNQAPASTPPPRRERNLLEGDPIRKRFRQGKIIRTQEAPVHSCNFLNKNGSALLATASWGANIHIFNLDNDDKNALVTTMGGDEEDQDDRVVRMGGLYDVQFAKSSQNILVAACADHFVYVWNYERNRLITRLRGHADEVNSIACHDSQQVICSTSDDTKAIVWDIAEGIKLRELTEHAKAAYGVTFMGADYPFNVATCSFDTKVRIYDMRDSHVIETLQEHYDDVIGLDFCDRNNWLASGSDDGTVCVWDVRYWDKPLFKINTQEGTGVPENEVKRVSFNADGTKLATGTNSTQALVYDLTGSSPELFAALEGKAEHTDMIFDVCYGVTGNGEECVVDASHDQSCFVWVPKR